jgi:hypothetical protein
MLVIRTAAVNGSNSVVKLLLTLLFISTFFRQTNLHNTPPEAPGVRTIQRPRLNNRTVVASLSFIYDSLEAYKNRKYEEVDRRIQTIGVGCSWMKKKRDDGREFPTTKCHFLSWLLPQLPSDNYMKKSAGRERDCYEELHPPFYLFSRLYRPNCVIRKALVLLLVLFPKRRPMRNRTIFLMPVI